MHTVNARPHTRNTPNDTLFPTLILELMHIHTHTQDSHAHTTNTTASHAQTTNTANSNALQMFLLSAAPEVAPEVTTVRPPPTDTNTGTHVLGISRTVDENGQDVLAMVPGDSLLLFRGLRVRMGIAAGEWGSSAPEGESCTMARGLGGTVLHLFCSF